MSSLLNLEKSQSKRILKCLHDQEKVSHLIFRLLGPDFQKKFSKIVDLDTIPRVLIHGNPHMDNYARTLTGAGMVDFDRSRLGPYAWDVIRFLASLTLRGEDADKLTIKDVLAENFMQGYLCTFNDPDIYYSIPGFIQSVLPQPEQLTTRNYVEANIKWAKKMRKDPIKTDDKSLNKMLKLYLESRGELWLLNHYKVSLMGQSEGSLGKMHYLIYLVPIEKSSKRDDILIDLKETYTEKDNTWFESPTEHHGLRMIKASNLYALGVEQRLGHFTYENEHYWGREIPSFNAKVKELMTLDEQIEMAYCVGTQLGRGHRRSCRDHKPKEIIKDIESRILTYSKVAQLINQEVFASLEYLEKTQEINLDDLKNASGE